MATAIEYFKLLPKTNCKDCGQPTCLAFAMLLANQKAKIEDCPHVSKESKAVLSESAAPLMRTVSVGTGGSAVEMGGETVIYRHERRFVNQTAYALTVCDDLEGKALEDRVNTVSALSFERVGMIFAADMISIKNVSGDPSRFAETAKAVSALWKKPLILETDDVSAMEKALEAVGKLRPMIYGAGPGNLDRMAALAKKHGCTLGIKADGPESAADLSVKAKAAGAEDLVLDLGCPNLKRCLEDQTVARRAAVKKKFKPLGYPLMNRVGCGEYAVAIAAVSTMKYGSLVIFDDLKNYEALPLMTLRQNIYTDPQVPIQVKQALYPIGNPGEHSPVMFTTNFSLTYFTVRADIEKSRIPVWLQIVNTEGLSVLTAYAAGKFEPEKVAEAFEESGVLSKTNGPVVVPGLVARMSGKLEEAIGRKVIVGTNESKHIPKHLKEITSQ
jgi:acetyl-CoA decarbonylase/synthase complex subunit gamma